MGNGICIVDDCVRPVFIKKRQLCRQCYMRAQARGLAGLSERHELTDRDYGRARATCSICGPDIEIRILTARSGLPQGQCKMGARVVRRRMLFGIEWEAFEKLLADAGGCCEICQVTLTIRNGQPPQRDTACLDHDHACCPGKFTCGKCVRGVLCLSCNIRLGYWERGQGLPIPPRAVEYLRRARTGK